MFGRKKSFDDMVDNIVNNTSEAPEEWIWVDGFKGTDRNMCGRGNYQYELGKQFDMPEDEPIAECVSGFHLCLNMDDVNRYYPIGDNNRFFIIRALVRKSDFEKYGEIVGQYHRRRNKLAAKSIVFVRELTMDEILEPYFNVSDTPEYYKKLSLEIGIKAGRQQFHIDELVALGYSAAVASYIFDQDKVNIAKVAASQPELSMDMRMLMILCHKK